MSLKALSEYTIVSRYALFNKEKGRRETWEESVSRVFDMHRKKYANEISKFPELGEAIDFAQKMQTKKRVLASQRSLQFAGDPILRHPLKIFNCLFSHIDRQRVFQEIMYSLLCGCGVGFSAQDQHVAKLSDIGPIDSEQKEVFVIPDSIEGWADSIGVLMGSYFCGVNEFSSYRGKNVEFDFSQIRPKGSLIAGQFKAPGPDGLRKTLEKIRDLLNERLSLFSGTCPLRPIDCYDIIMHISDAVLSGGVRRAATLCLFSHDNQEMMTAKTGNWFNDNPQRARSNNSAALLKGSTTREEFSILMKSTKEFGEPAFIWLDDLDVGYNPCCVTGDTRVDTNQGDIKIKDLIDRYEIEDIKVLSYNIKEDRVEYKNIIAGKLTRRDAELVKIITSNNVQLTCTPDHKIYTLNRGYVQAQDLICDDDLDGDSIWSVEYLDRVEDTYDIEVEDNHNFYANGILVHNCEIGMYPKTSDGRSGFSACNLTEINGKYCDTKDNFLMACEASAIIGTLQAGYTNIEYLSKESREIFENEALLGCSITGMMDNPNLLFDPKIQQEAAKFILEVNANIAKMIGINPAARATCVKPAGSSSCILGTSSGIHPHHSKKYIRRVQANKSEFCLETMEKFNPLAVEESVWSSGGTDKIVSFLCEVPVGSIVKNQLGAVELLEKVKLTQNNWVEYGTRKELCSIPSMRHNVSNTITVKPEEWDDVEKFIFDNQQWFAGISLLPSSGDLDYAQAPFSTVLTPSEIVREYGEGSVFASGLIVDALAAFKDNLWVACENALNGDISDGYPACPSFKLTFWEKANIFFSKNKQRKIIKERADQYRDLVRPILAKSDWVRRATQFSDRYFGGDTKRMTYCLKHVSLWKTWCDLKREYKDIDWPSQLEERQTYVSADTLGAQACSGGKCDIF